MIREWPRLSVVSDLEAAGDSPSFQAVLSQLAHSDACAQEANCDRWDFAVEIHNLIATGLMIGDLRRMVKMGYVEHAVEVTRPKDTSRKFRRYCNLSFNARTCFVLGDAGVELAESLGARKRSCQSMPPSQGPTGDPAPDRSVPSWDRERRVLCVDGHVVKQFKQPSPSQEAILTAFEEEGWPPAIDDPLSPQPEQDAKHRLRKTILKLNGHQEDRRLHFRGDGSGERVLWELVAQGARQSSVLKLRHTRAA